MECGCALLLVKTRLTPTSYVLRDLIFFFIEENREELGKHGVVDPLILRLAVRDTLTVRYAAHALCLLTTAGMFTCIFANRSPDLRSSIYRQDRVELCAIAGITRIMREAHLPRTVRPY